MPAPKAPRKVEPHPAEPETAPPPRPFRHQAPIQEDADERLEHGHGSGCIPVIVIRFSLLALLIWLACVLAGFFLTGKLDHHPAPTAVSAGRP